MTGYVRDDYILINEARNKEYWSIVRYEDNSFWIHQYEDESMEKLIWTDGPYENSYDAENAAFYSYREYDWRINEPVPIHISHQLKEGSA